MLLVFVGLVMVFSASAVMARERFGSRMHFCPKQLIWAAGGPGGDGGGDAGGLPALQGSGGGVFVIGDHTLLLISVFFLDRSHNTHRWIHAAVLVSTVELAKPVLILFLAYFLEGRVKTMDDWRNTLLPAGACS